MTVAQAVLLGAIQGLTEFLPVSSRGHLALAQALMPGFSQPGLVFDVSLHLGTVVAIVALEWKKIVEAIRERYLAPPRGAAGARDGGDVGAGAAAAPVGGGVDPATRC